MAISMAWRQKIWVVIPDWLFGVRVHQLVKQWYECSGTNNTPKQISSLKGSWATQIALNGESTGEGVKLRKWCPKMKISVLSDPLCYTEWFKNKI